MARNYTDKDLAKADTSKAAKDPCGIPKDANMSSASGGYKWTSPTWGTGFISAEAFKRCKDIGKAFK